MDDEVGILIVGAGMSGVAMADGLNRFGITDFLILEGQDKVGGRMKSHTVHAEDRENDIIVEMGANWIHGVTGNYLTELANIITSLVISATSKTWLFTTNMSCSMIHNRPTLAQTRMIFTTN